MMFECERCDKLINEDVFDEFVCYCSDCYHYLRNLGSLAKKEHKDLFEFERELKLFIENNKQILKDVC